MAKTYKLKSLSVTINGQVFRKGKDEPKGGFVSGDRFPEKQMDKLVEAGFLEEVKKAPAKKAPVKK